jgi:imidazolonepropionase-like amidohydrolase
MKTALPSALLSAFLISSLVLPTQAQARTIIYAGTLIDGDQNQAQHAMSIVIEDKKITSIESGYILATEKDQIIDLKNDTITPGWIDCHDHLDSEITPKSFTDGVYLEPGDYALHAAFNAKKTLLAGFTTIRNLGDSDNSTLALKRAISKGYAIGPRIYTAGAPIGTTGGHADPTDGYNHKVTEAINDKSVIDGADAARKAVRQHYKDGTDLIKIMTSGGVLSVEKSGDNPQMDMDEIKAIVTTAHEYGMKVAVHAHGTEAIRRSIMAGVDSIEHGTYMDAEDLRLMKEHGTFYVPTLSAGRWVAEKAKEHGFFPELVRPKALAIGPKLIETCRAANSAGVRIVFGTDTGVSEHGDNAKEFAYLVEAGLSPMKAIKCATSEAAALIGDSTIGSIAVGKYADIVGVKGDLLADITLAHTAVNFVMKDGVTYKNP